MFLFSAESNAQVPVKLGIRAGVDLANAAVNEPPPGVTLSSSIRTGVSIGAALEVKLRGPFSILSELRYTQKGAIHNLTASPDGMWESGKVTGTIEYFDLPVTLQAKFGSGFIRPYLFAGPSLGVLISSNLVTETSEGSVTDDLRDQTEPAELGLDFGGGIALAAFPRASILVDVRYSLGFTNIAKRQDQNDPSFWKSRDIKILVGVMFDL